MAIPDYETLMLPVLKAVADGPKHIRVLIGDLADYFGLSAEEREAKIPSGTNGLFSNRVHWAKTYLKQAGAVEQPARGLVSITDRGRDLIATYPTRIDNSILIQFDEFRAFRSRKTPRPGLPKGEESVVLPIDAIAETSEERIGRAADEIETAHRQDILVRLKSSDPSFFEGVVLDVLKALGYGAGSGGIAEVVGRSGDGGIDGVIDEDRLGLDRIYVQAKRFGDTTVGSSVIREFIGSLHTRGATKGVLFTTSSFSSAAVAETTKNPAMRIVLIDGDRLAALMIHHNVGVRTKRTIEIKDIDLDYFESVDA